MRTVLKNQSEVAHAWANQIQGYASCGPLRFSGEYAFSYNTAIARRHVVNGHVVIVIRDVFFSNTTNKHKRTVQNAATHCIVLSCSSGIDSLQEALLQEQGKVIDILMEIFTGRSIRGPFSIHTRNIDAFNGMVTRLGHEELRLDIPSDFLTILKSEYDRKARIHEAKIAARAEEFKRIQELKRAEAEKKIKKALPIWLQGGHRDAVLDLVQPSLIRVKDNRVETTRGASVPFQAALVLLGDLNARHRVVGKSIHGFPITKVEGDLITIGCHTLSIEQCSKVILKGEEK